MRPQATFSFFFFIFITFSFFLSPCCSFLLVAPSSSSQLPPRPYCLLVPPSPSSLFLPRPALSKPLRILKRSFFIDFDESVTNRRTNQPTDGRTDHWTDKASYRNARTHLKSVFISFRAMETNAKRMKTAIRCNVASVISRDRNSVGAKRPREMTAISR